MIVSLRLLWFDTPKALVKIVCKYCKLVTKT